MSTIKLPPPSFYHKHEDICGNEVGPPTPFWNQTAAEEAVRQALAEAAEICAEEGREWDSDGVILYKNYAEHCAQRIRALYLEPRDG